MMPLARAMQYFPVSKHIDTEVPGDGQVKENDHEKLTGQATSRKKQILETRRY